MEALFEKTFVKSLGKHSGIKKPVKRKVQMIMDHPLELGKPLRGNWRGFYSCPVRKNFLIIYLYCYACRKKGDDVFVACSDCEQHGDETLKFVLLAPHDEAYGI